MNLQNRKPIFVPPKHWREIEQCSKAALMDIAWDYAKQLALADSDDIVMEGLRERISLIENYRIEHFRK